MCILRLTREAERTGTFPKRFHAEIYAGELIRDRQTVDLFNNKVILWSSKLQGGSKADASVLEPNEYHFPFIFQLPPDSSLPSSYESRMNSCHIRYSLYANVDRPWRFDYNTAQPITYVQVIDCNHPEYFHQIEREDEKTICCCCCAQGPIVGRIKVPHLAFCAGETMQVDVTIDNFANREVGPCKIFLRRTSHYRANGRSHYEQQNFGIAEYPDKIPRRVEGPNVRTLGYVVPAVSPSIKSAIIDVSYEVVLSVANTGALGMTLAVPITIGTVPRNQPQNNIQQYSPQYVMNYGLAHPGQQQIAPPPAYTQGQTNDNLTYQPFILSVTGSGLAYAPSAPPV
eukprot:TRINITY_DN4749_c0_g1_i1.p1 TRINITY_DN4749_c0_g1~~TRINITY_DN4749_c0_g1_i1.p1  ORF type:complete len:342 (+),score=13.77 TRINITY_DN4749_c0_g1_i1:273-1298(+)